MVVAAPLLREPPTGHDTPSGSSFSLAAPIVAFMKSDAPMVQQRRIAGIISTDGLDQQNEVLVQEGLTFDKFLKTGNFNDNHASQSTLDIVGYPTSVSQFSKGDTLPNGETAKSNCTWAEGFLIGHKGKQIWEMAKDLEGTHRSLGFSVEGSIIKRDKDDRSKVLKAEVTACAVCANPVNVDAKLELLARSLNPNISKTMCVGDLPATVAAQPAAGPDGEKPAGAVGGTLTEQFPDPRPTLRKKAKKRKNKATSLLTRSAALRHIRATVPGISKASAVHILKTALAMADNGLT